MSKVELGAEVLNAFAPPGTEPTVPQLLAMGLYAHNKQKTLSITSELSSENFDKAQNFGRFLEWANTTLVNFVSPQLEQAKLAEREGNFATLLKQTKPAPWPSFGLNVLAGVIASMIVLVILFVSVWYQGGDLTRLLKAPDTPSVAQATG
jgi:hypothetical protein